MGPFGLLATRRQYSECCCPDVLYGWRCQRPFRMAVRSNDVIGNGAVMVAALFPLSPVQIIRQELDERRYHAAAVAAE